MADGAIYYVSKKFINKVLKSDNPNLTFWNSKTKFIENHSPFIDIDTPEDLEQFYNIIYYF